MSESPASNEPVRLNLGGTEARPGWKILDIQKRPEVDYVGSVTDLSQFKDGSVSELYASHVYEHLNYHTELRQALKEACRVLKPGGILRVGVPDLEQLCKFMLDPRHDVRAKFHVTRMIFGGQTDDYDYHKVGLTYDILGVFLNEAGFKSFRRVDSFGMFNDCTATTFDGKSVSLNVIAMK